ncbi:universal stress protein [Aquimarina sp. ERC-38]|uniref:universal stress protein n=1 Tax=Aquimarina sp. ERC-38 TaxID=2949996 RepID=UPI002247E7A3|nr:universal stress protein [Aquimarina sp. ERC-38]UZO81230.1 universal stress protein [Aquimarina sp. ERC-38]
MKKILVPTDFSEQAESALKVAAQLAKKYQSQIYLLHIIELPVHLVDLMATPTPSAPEAIYFMKETHKKFEELLAKEYLNGIEVHETVSFEDIREGVMSTCTKNMIDFIVMGSHGSSGFEEFFIGSNAEKIVRFAKQPVLVIKEDCDVFNIGSVVYATNFEVEEKPAIAAIANFAKQIEAQLHVVWINTASSFKSTKEAEDEMKNMLSGIDVVQPSLSIYNDTNVEKGILNFAESVNAGLIGIGTHGRKGLSHFINGSVGEDVVNHAKRPVLTYKI